MGDINDGSGCKMIVLNDKGNKVEVSEDDISRFLRTKLAGVRKELIEFFKERDITLGFGNILDIDEGALFFKVKQSIRNHNKIKLELVANDQRNAYSQTVNKNFALAKELGIELAQFDHLEWNKLALEVAKENLKCNNAHDIANEKMIKGVENLKTNQAAPSIGEQMKRICP